MKEYLKKYSDKNPERFNKEFILSRDKQDIIEDITAVFKSLETLDEIKVEEVSIEKDEAALGPIKAQHHYYKSVYPSRLEKIHYRVRITPNEDITQLEPISLGNYGNKDTKKVSKDSYIREGDLYVNKLIDDCFYINEGVRYYLIYQIVDNNSYGTKDAVSLKSLFMPITVRRDPNPTVFTPCFEKDPVELRGYNVLLFNKNINPLLYFFALESYNAIAEYKVKDPNNTFNEWNAIRIPEIIDKFNEFFGTDFKFDDDMNKLVEPGRTIFKISNNSKAGRSTDEECYVSVSDEKLKNDNNTKVILGCLLTIKKPDKKHQISFNVDQLTSPWFWIEEVSGFFTRNGDFMKRIQKIRTMLISMNRLMDDTTRKILNLDDEDKKNTLTIIRYILRNFDALMNADSKDLDQKRLRLFEYEVYPLRLYFSNHIYRILNSPTHSKAVLDKIFSNLKPMFLITSIVKSELLRYYNSSNECNLFSCLLRYTFRGPQSLSKTVTMEQRDLHPSYVGRLSLICSSAGDPGISGNMVPFVQTYDYYFKPQKK